MYYSFTIWFFVGLLAPFGAIHHSKQMHWSKWCFRRKQIVITWVLLAIFAFTSSFLGALNNPHSQLFAGLTTMSMLFVPCGVPIYRKPPGCYFRQILFALLTGSFLLDWMWDTL